MNDFEFKKGIEQIEGAKAYAPPESLILWCWDNFKTLDPNLWMEACKILTTYDKKAREFTNMDFKRAIQCVRDEMAKKAKREEYEIARHSRDELSPWRDKILNAIDEAEGPEQRTFFEDILRRHDEEHTVPTNPDKEEPRRAAL